MKYILRKVLQANPELNIDILEQKEWVSIKSPIPSNIIECVPIYESNNSASFNYEQGLVTDHREGKTYTEISLIRELEGITQKSAYKLKDNYNKSSSLIEYSTLNAQIQLFNNSKKLKEISTKYFWKINSLKELNMYCISKEEFSLPIYNNQQILNIVEYFPNTTLKWKYSTGITGSILVNYDKWLYKKTPTYICEGIKDFITLYDKGYNAVTLTNGAKSLPEFYINAFKNKEIYIIYDNDKTGIEGANKLASYLYKNCTEKIKIIDLKTNCKELKNKEDIWDYFNIYKKTILDFDTLIKSTDFISRDKFLEIQNKEYPSLEINLSRDRGNSDKTFQTIIEVRGKGEGGYILPETVHVKYSRGEDQPLIDKIYDTTYKIKDLFEYLKPQTIQREKILKKIISGYTKDKKTINISHYKVLSKESIHIYEISQASGFYTNKKEESISEVFTCYILGNQLKMNKKYQITYITTDHPDSKGEPITIILDAVLLESAQKGFQLTASQIKDLKIFQQSKIENIETTLQRRFKDACNGLWSRLDYNLWLGLELLFHSVLDYRVVNDSDYSGAIICLLLGDPGFGKSRTYDLLAELYNKGHYVTASNTTTPALIGGTVMKGNSRPTVAGIVSSQHKGLIAMEEFTKVAKDTLESLTDLVTRKQTQIGRAGKELTIVSDVRWLFIGNTNTNRKIHEYNNGIQPLNDLGIPLQWHRRFTYVLEPSSEKDYEEEPTFVNNGTGYKMPYDLFLYKLKTDWVWSREIENVNISQDLYKIAYKYSIQWLKTYGTSIDLVGDQPYTITEKILRIAIALACYLFSTDDGINVKVIESHIKYAYKYLILIYDNNNFNVKQYAKEYEAKSICNNQDILNLQELFNTYPDFIENLYYIETELQLKEIANLNSVLADFRKISNNVIPFLMREKFIIRGLKGFHSSAKFKQAYNKINKDRLKELTKVEDIINSNNDFNPPTGFDW